MSDKSKILGELLTPVEAGEALQISAATIRRWLRDGVITGHKIGKQWRVNVDELRAYLTGQADHVVTVEIENLSDDETPGHKQAWAWFMSKTPEDRATAIIRAWQDRQAWES